MRKRKRKGLLLIFILILISPILAGKHFKVIEISDGLPNNTVKCITQDKQGFIWMGTFSGLCKFDGISFSIFQHNPQDSLSISGNQITALLAEEKGIWIGTDHGLDYLSFSDNLFYPCSQLLHDGKSARISQPIKIIKECDNELFVLTSSGRLLKRINNRTFQTCVYEAQTYWCSISVYSDNFLLAHSINGIFLLDVKQDSVVSRFLYKSKVSDVIFCSKNSKLVYIGFGLGHATDVFTLTDELLFRPSNAQTPPNLKVIVDYKEYTVFGTDGNGLILLNNGYYENYNPSNCNFKSDAVFSLFVDNNDNLWAGTHRGGVYLYSPLYDRFTSLTREKNRLTHNFVTAVIAQNEKIYVGLDGGGLNIYNEMNGETEIYNTGNSALPANNILSLSMDEQQVWMGIYGKGLGRFSLSARSFKIFPVPLTPENFEPNNLWKIEDDNNGNIWVVGRGISIFNKETTVFTPVTALSDFFISGIVFDGDIAWVSTFFDGLYKINKKTKEVIRHYSTYSEEFQIIENTLKFVFRDSKHQVWFCAEYSGLYKLDEVSGVITHYGKENGLTELNVVGMLEATSGNLWLATYNGLFLFDPASEVFTHFGEEDNISSTQYNYNACYKDYKRMYFGSANGLIHFNPDSIKYAPKHNTVYFTDLNLLNGEKIFLNALKEGDKEIQLTHKQNFFTIHFSIPEYIYPKKIIFSCFMEGFDDGWRNIYNRQVIYTNVPPGEYLFHVRTSDNEKIWDDNISSLRIKIAPPWWKTFWAYLLWITMVLGLLAALFWVYQYNLKIKHLVQIKEMEKNTAKNINEAKLNFFTNISHELRTPIFLITTPIEELLSSKTNIVQVSKPHLLAIYRQALRLSKLINRIIDFRKLESGKLKLNIQRLNVVSFCKELTIDYETLCQQKDIVFLYQPEKTTIDMDFDPEKLESILANLVSNAYKYTPEGGKIIFSLQEIQNSVVFIIEDNGIGIKKEFHDLIFEDFFQVDASSGSTGDGIGLSFVKHLVEVHGGKVKIESEPDSGSRFSFEIPKQLTKNATNMVEENVVIRDIKISESKKSGTPHSPAATHTILIIDDNTETLDIIERALLEDFKILKAKNGSEGLVMVQEFLPDIIICDMMMPKVDGMEFLKLVRGDKKYAHIPIIILTAKSLEDDMIAAYGEGAEAYLTKPVSLKYLRTRIDSLLTHSESTEKVKSLSKYSKEEKLFLLRCKEIIDINLTNPDFDVVFFANALNMSHSTFYKKIKNITGQSAIEFINDYRIFKAVQYFSEGETNTNIVAQKCGFNDTKNFRELFKLKMKMTPKKYVQQLFP